MTTGQALVSFVLGFARAAGLTFIIQTFAYWDFYLSVLLVVGTVGGVMTMKSYEEDRK